MLRARDYHSKQERIQLLREKAAMRNKDEFYFSMTKERTVVRPEFEKQARAAASPGSFLQGGVHTKDRGNQALPADIIKVLKTQDENYLRTTRAAGQKVRVLPFHDLSPLTVFLPPENRQPEGATEPARKLVAVDVGGG